MSVPTHRLLSLSIANAVMLPSNTGANAILMYDTGLRTSLEIGIGHLQLRNLDFDSVLIDVSIGLAENRQRRVVDRSCILERVRPGSAVKANRSLIRCRPGDFVVLNKDVLDRVLQ